MIILKDEANTAVATDARLPKPDAKPLSKAEDRKAGLTMDLYRFIRAHQDRPKDVLQRMIGKAFSDYTPDELREVLKVYIDNLS